MQTEKRAVYLIDKEMGINRVPLTVKRKVNGKIGSAQQWVDAEEVLNSFYGEKIPVWKKKETAKMQLFDLLTQNTDRHRLNYLINKKEKKYVYIDNGLSLFDSFDPSPLHEGERVQVRNAFKLMTKKEVESFAQGLKKIRSDAFIKTLENSNIGEKAIEGLKIRADNIEYILQMEYAVKWKRNL